MTRTWIRASERLPERIRLRHAVPVRNADGNPVAGMAARAVEETLMHRVYVCCDRESDLIYKDQLVGMEEWDPSSSDWVSVFSGCSPRGDLETGPAVESLGVASESVRENHTADADVIILLCGENTKGDGQTGSELSAAMREGGKNGRIGVLAFNLPTIEGRQCRVSVEGGDAYVEDRRGGRRLLGETTGEEIEDAFPFLPEEIIENLKKDICIPVVDWTDVCGDPARLRGLMDAAARCLGSGC